VKRKRTVTPGPNGKKRGREKKSHFEAWSDTADGTTLQGKKLGWHEKTILKPRPQSCSIIKQRTKKRGWKDGLAMRVLSW